MATWGTNQCWVCEGTQAGTESGADRHTADNRTPASWTSKLGQYGEKWRTPDKCIKTLLKATGLSVTVTNTLPMDAFQAASERGWGRPTKPGFDTNCPQGLADTRLPLPALAASLAHSPVVCEGAHAICVSANRAGSLVDPTAEKGLTPSALSLRVCSLGRSYKAGLRDGLAANPRGGWTGASVTQGKAAPEPGQCLC